MDATPAERPPPSRRTLVLIAGPILAVVVVGTLGNMLHPVLLRDHPLWLVAMEPRNRFLLLVAGKVDFVPFLVVATLRRVSSDPLFFLLGALYGDRGVRWVERRLGDDLGMVRTIERAFSKAAPLMVFLFPGAIVCVLAGATGMSTVTFLTLNVAGTIAAVVVLYGSASLLGGPVGAVNDFYAQHTGLLTALSIAAVVAWLWRQHRKGTSEFQSLSSIERDLDEGRDAGTGHEAGHGRGAA